MAAAVTSNTIVAGKCLVAYYIQNSQFVCKSPSLALVNPHQGSMDSELVVQCEIKCDVEAFDECVSTIRVAAEIGLTDACDNIMNSMLACINGSDADKKHVAARHKGGWRSS